MKHLLSCVRRCMEDYAMIQPGDRVAVGVSGGKDSLVLLCALARLRTFYPIPFEVEAITLDMGFPGCDFSGIQALCDRLEVPYTVIQTDIAPVIFDIRKEDNPCSLCAKMRRGALHDAALQKNCRTVALGHHFDDTVETFFLSLFYEGRINCYSPVTYLDRKGITLIRPMLYMKEQEIVRLKNKYELPVVHNPCPADGYTKRQYIKEMLAKLEGENPGLRDRLFGAVQRSALPGWQPVRIEKRRKSHEG